MKTRTALLVIGWLLIALGLFPRFDHQVQESAGLKEEVTTYGLGLYHSPLLACRSVSRVLQMSQGATGEASTEWEVSFLSWSLACVLAGGLILAAVTVFLPRAGAKGNGDSTVVLSLALAILASPTPLHAQAGRVFRAGAATSNITPPLGSSINGGMQDRRAAHVHDELHARCLVLDDGTTQLAIAVCDLCMIPRHITDEARRRVHEATRIPPAHVLISATHTHEAPTCTGVFQSDPVAGYAEQLAARIADGVRRAGQNLAPARIGWGSVPVPEHVFNRRWRKKPGTIPPNPFGATDQVQMNPPVGSPDLVEPAGPTDPELFVVSLQSPAGRPLAVLGNYSLHYVGGEGPGHISADYYGMFADRLQELLGADRQDPPFVGLLSNGTSGDLNNINFRGEARPTEPYAQMRRVSGSVAAAAAGVVRRIEHRDWVQLGAAQAALELGVRKPTTGQLAKARDIVGGAKGPAMQSLEEIYARETILIADYPDRVELLLQALRLGDLCIFAAPCEVFVEIGLELKAKSPIRPCFTVSLANGYNGYLPTPAHHQLGGYETWRARSSYLEVEAAPRITAKLLELAAGLQKP